MHIKLNKNYVVTIAVLLLAGCATNSTHILSWNNNSTKSPDLEQHQTDPQMKINTNLANVIFIRNANISPTSFVNVYVEDHYLGSLGENGFKQQNVCSLRQKITVTSNSLNRYAQFSKAVQYFDFARNKTNVVEVSEVNNQLKLTLLDNNTLDLNYIERLKRQTNTISRAKNYFCSTNLYNTAQ